MVEGVNFGTEAAVLNMRRGAGTNFAGERAVCVVVGVIGTISGEAPLSMLVATIHARHMLRTFASHAVWRKSRERRQTLTAGPAVRLVCIIRSAVRPVVLAAPHGNSPTGLTGLTCAAVVRRAAYLSSRATLGPSWRQQRPHEPARATSCAP